MENKELLLKLYKDTLEKKWIPLTMVTEKSTLREEMSYPCCFCEDCTNDIGTKCKVSQSICYCVSFTERGLLQDLFETADLFEYGIHQYHFLRRVLWIVVEAIRREIKKLEAF